MALIGRETEQNRIRAALSDLPAGRGGMLLLCGEAGIGKSTLARWAAEQSAGEGIAVHWGVCWEAGGAPAYWPWSQLLRSLLDADAARIEQMRASPALFQLLPELAAGNGAAAMSQADQARFLREGGSTLFPEELDLLGDLDDVLPAALLDLQRDHLPVVRLGDGAQNAVLLDVQHLQARVAFPLLEAEVDGGHVPHVDRRVNAGIDHEVDTAEFK